MTGLALVLVCACAEVETPRDVAAEPPIRVATLDAYRPPVATTVAPGDTIESVCRRLAGDDWPRWRDALIGEIDPRGLRPGTEFVGSKDRLGRLEELQTTLDLRTRVVFRMAGESISRERIERPIQSAITRYEGTVTSSLFGAIQTAGAEPELAVRMASIFQWDVDFLRDLRQGDTFVVLVDRQTVDGAFFGYGTLYGARFVNAGRELTAIAYMGPDGRVGYYDLDGQPLRKQFLRSPLKFSRITSRFNLRRFHPILKRTIPHYGVDYGAPVGTPVMATADGVVTLAGRNGGAGNMVRLRHPNGYETSYLHLSRYGNGIARGARVSQGQIVGYVGSTGLSTGPHLDYRVRKDGSWINPLGISSPPAEPLPDDLLERYLPHALALLQVLNGGETPPGARC
jgi:murein DD-endopeptidase MepM/ murein hydrolase activator NlpD